jgi:hypothetical protein
VLNVKVNLSLCLTKHHAMKTVTFHDSQTAERTMGLTEDQCLISLSSAQMKSTRTSGTSKHVHLTAWSRVPLEELIVAQVVKKFPALYGIRRFITVFTRSRHWSLS